jgi:uncharacterized Actinobacterial protein TIGR03083
MDVWEMIDAERTELADLCETLTPEQWDTVSLCDQWRVRDVIAHLNEGATMTFGTAVVTLARYGFRLGAMLTSEAIKGGAVAPNELVSGLRATVGKRLTPPGVKPPGTLTDTVIHQQDIRRALNVPRVIPSDRLAIVLDETKNTSASLLPGKKRIAGLRLDATDMDWSVGDAGTPEVSGTGEALLMAMAGRAVACPDLTGAGVATLRSRI